MTHGELRDDQPSLLRRAACALTAAAALTLCAGAATARDMAPAPEPSVVEVELDTASLFWDLCVGPKQAESQRALASAIVEALENPESLYVVRLPQTPPRWETPSGTVMRDLHGDLVDRRRLAMTRGTYEQRLEQALLNVLDIVEAERPGARATLEGFRSLPERLRRDESYQRLESTLPFVTVDADAPLTNRGAFNKWLEDMHLDEGAPSLVRTSAGWLLVGEQAEMAALTAPPEVALASAWSAPSEPEPVEAASKAPEAIEGQQSEVSRDVAASQSIADVGLETLAALENAPGDRDWSRHLRVDSPESTRGSQAGDPDPTNPDGPAPGDDSGDDPGDDPGVEPGFGRLLIAGAGFDGPTPQPAAVGSPALPGHDAQAIARWNVVPYQTIEESFELGVVAFHINGIDRVEFSLSGGPWVEASEMRYNPRTDTAEYWVTLDPSRVPDGFHEVRARVIPAGAGVPRLLAGPHDMSNDDVRIRGEHSIFLTTNANGTYPAPERWVSTTGSDDDGDGSRSNPFRTIAHAAADIQDSYGRADGGMIYLEEGDYDVGETRFRSVPRTSERWLTIAGAPDADPAEVRLVSSSGNGLRTDLTRFHNLTMHDMSPRSRLSSFNRVWGDAVAMTGDGPLDGRTVLRGASWTGGFYLTDSEYRDMPYAIREAQLARNITISRIGGDAIRELRGMAVNIEVRDLLNLDNTHNDVVQFYSNQGSDPFENIIIYNLAAVDNIAGQAFFMRTSTDQRDFAIVNYLVGSTGAGGAQWIDSADHVLLWNYQQLRNGFMVRDEGDDDPTIITNLSIRDSVFERFRLSNTGWTPSMSDQSWAQNNHYVDIESFQSLAPGEGATTGGTHGSLFVDPTINDFRPRNGSVLAERDFEIDVTHDAMGRPRLTPASIGALEAGQR